MFHVPGILDIDNKLAIQARNRRTLFHKATVYLPNSKIGVMQTIAHDEAVQSKSQFCPGFTLGRAGAQDIWVSIALSKSYFKVTFLSRTHAYVYLFSIRMVSRAKNNLKTGKW